MSYFSTNLKKIRQIHNLSQSAFAELLNLNRGVISSYEEQRAQPKIETVLRIAEHFNLSSDELLSAPLTVNRLTKFELENSKEPLKLDPPIEKQISFQQWSRNNGSQSFDSSSLKDFIDLVYVVDASFSQEYGYEVDDILFLKRLSHSAINVEDEFILIEDQKIALIPAAAATQRLKKSPSAPVYRISGKIFQSRLSQNDRISKLESQIREIEARLDATK